MSTDDEESKYPRSVRHKQILDKAEAHPDASMDDLASMVPSATTELVERTLNEYGDPATTEESDSLDGNSEQDTVSGDATATEPNIDGKIVTDMTDAETTTDNSTESPAMSEAGDPAGAEKGVESATSTSVDTAHDGDDGHDEDQTTEGAEQSGPTSGNLSPKQREVLECIAANPTATQREIGEQLGVSSATVNNRVNSIDGFEWADRASFVDSVFESDATIESEPTEESDAVAPGEIESTLADIEGHLTALDERIASLEDRLDQSEGPSERVASGLDDPELVHKVVHACLESERVTEEEELQLLQRILC